LIFPLELREADMNKIRAVALVAAVGASSFAQASDNGIYVGLSAGSIEASVNKDTANNLTEDFNGSDAAYKAILGIRPLNWLGAEVSYMDLGKVDSGALAADSTGVSVYAVGFVSVLPMVDLFAKGGVVNWKSKITSGSSELFSEDGTDPAYGAGLIVHFGSLSARAEYEHFEIDDSANLVSLGLTWTFL
jgi:hypothetical protein